MDIIESKKFYREVLNFVKEADKDEDGILKGEVIESKFLRWSNMIFSYLQEKGWAANVIDSDVNFNKDEIPAIIALLEEKIKSFQIQFWLHWLPISISFASLVMSIIAICK